MISTNIETGVNISVFSFPSTRLAASSMISKNSMNLAEISKAGGWSKVKTLAVLYKKTISEDFGQVMLRAQYNLFWRYIL